MLARLPIEVPLACCLPEVALRRLAATVAQRSRAEQVERLLPRAASLVGGRELRMQLQEALRRQQASSLLVELMTLRCWRPGGWHPDTHLEGRAHLDAALSRGRGAILWSGPFVFTGLLAKLTLREAGVAVSHLSRYRHGFSPTWLGIHALNPLRTRIEERFLAERLVIRLGSWAGGLRQLKRRLAENRVVSITVHHLGGRTVEVPFLDGHLRIAPGAPALARRTGAALLPMMTIAARPGRYATIIMAPLEAPPELEEQAAIESLVGRYARLLEAQVPRWPDQFNWGAPIMVRPSADRQNQGGERPVGPDQPDGRRSGRDP